MTPSIVKFCLVLAFTSILLFCAGNFPALSSFVGHAVTIAIFLPNGANNFCKVFSVGKERPLSIRAIADCLTPLFSLS